MIIIPAIDIKNGKVVRLTQGQFAKEKVYDQDPLSVAQRWKQQGATLIHIVDLDGAEKGKPQNLAIIQKIQREIGVNVQMGGGIRAMETVQEVLGFGLMRIIIGTRAIEDKEFLKDILSTYGDKVAVSLDCVNGYVAIKGWTTVSHVSALSIIPELERLGLRTLIYTDIATDGMLQGPNLKSLAEILASTSVNVIASGGISQIDDIKQLAYVNAKNLYGVIIGKALYEQTINLSDAIQLCSKKE
ncbi:MAG TPA: 1-(5-phosphoribosyl)-5-[(5-phosphoribosylamino)methylideneamino]imidazole-4-carboxamide isomerase [Candidatus Omnitrophota bacterium]|nr:1-(5-phosphoribosyl)-5-[(5-phosphoribosylamino)methylideneamino]imidazole-4-carboxamide isomerase [Candidatus Omnitrophota bacterium]HQL40996.1 1-(5-phosphoribosyl)-5-[(5-phosphoribosylamino)methylideneamino]imidazole-4-carboxamide isomerase [Candidatus Omnitrophota bacterium]